jgi:predicted TPR repeat methyltransferase
LSSAVEAWERYAEKARPRRLVNAVGATTWLNWTQYADHGPDESVLGDVTGRLVLELGSGSGSNLAHLATLGARCTGVDIAPSRTAAAAQAWGHLPNVQWVTADVVTYLSSTQARFDMVYSIFGAVWFTDPMVLLPLVRAKMTSGGVFAFSHLPATDQNVSVDRVIRKREYPADRWVQRLTAAGFGSATAEVISGPASGRCGTLLVRALAA